MTEAPRRRLVLHSVLLVAALVVTYLVSVRTGLGQRVDYRAFEGRKAVLIEVRRATTAVMRLATPLLLAAVCSAAVVIAIRDRRVRAAALVLGSTGATIVASRVLKRVLPRTDVLEFSYANTANTFPSGHAATVMALALAALVLCPVCWWRRAAWVVAAIVSLDLAALLGSGWHRPSDVLGGLFLAASIMSAGMALLGPATVVPVEADAQAVEQQPRLLAMSVAVAIGSLLPLLVLRYSKFVPEHPLHLFTVAVVTTNLCAAALLWWHLRVLRECAALDGGSDLRP